MTDNKDPIKEFEQEKEERIKSYPKDKQWHKLSKDWLYRGFQQYFMYNFNCCGRPIIQVPNDLMAIHEIIWEVKPDLIIEMGIAHGGSLMFSASQLALLDYCDAIKDKKVLDPNKPKRKVLGVDIDIRAHNKAKIENHPLFNHIDMIEGSSIEDDIINQVHKYSKNFNKILVILDSNHTHDHVLAELKAYAPLVSVGSYCITLDTMVEDLPDDLFPNRPWSHGNNPKTAVWEYLKTHNEFVADKMVEDKLMITCAPDGYLKRVK